MIDLHLHLDGSLAPEEVPVFASMSGVSLLTENVGELRNLRRYSRNLGEYLEKFELPLQVLQTAETMGLSVCGLVKRIAGQGLCYAEIRFASQLHTRRGLTQRAVTEAVVRGLKKGIRENGMPFWRCATPAICRRRQWIPRRTTRLLFLQGRESVYR